MARLAAMAQAHSERSILHLDADAFFASVEQRDDPSLRGRPVAVGTGVVASCSYEARRYGVRTGMRLAEARTLCRELVVVPGEYPRYEQTARRMQAICQEQTPLVEMAALDDLYLDLTLAVHGAVPLADSTRTAETLHRQIWDEARLRVSIGVGSNKLVAKVATKDVKQRKAQALDQAASPVVLVAPGRERDYLAPWPVRVLPGAGGQISARLERLNVQRVAEVAAMPVPLLRGLFGRSGRVLHEQAQGIDLRPVEPRRPPQSVSRCTSFEPPTADLAFLGAMLDYLLERAVTWLRFQDLATRGLTVTIRYGDYASADGRVPLRRPTADTRFLQEAARERFGQLYTRRLPLRLLGVALAPLAPPERQAELFPDPADERARRLEACTDAIRRRYGFTALLSGSALVLAQQLDRDRENFRLRTPCLTR